MMNKKDIEKYLQNELKEEREEMMKLENELNSETDKFKSFGIAAKLGKQQDKYYYLWMLCNDIGVANI